MRKKPNTDQQIAFLCSAFPEILAFAMPGNIFSITALCTEKEWFQGFSIPFDHLCDETQWTKPLVLCDYLPMKRIEMYEIWFIFCKNSNIKE